MLSKEGASQITYPGPDRKAWKGIPLLTLAKNFARLDNSREMIRKVMVRVQGKGWRSEQAAASARWCAGMRSDLADYCNRIDANLWREATEVCDRIRQSATNKLRHIDIDLGGGGNYPLLYFTVRHRAPDVVVETGVAAGFSSYAILKALHANNHGRLYSSDFPYFRLADPEKYIGIVVEEHFKKDWLCLTAGDEKNLPQILARVPHIDVFHYDSDKSYQGRQRALRAVRPYLSKGATVIMDDINDNCFFRDFVTSDPAVENVRVFEFENKYVGLFTQS